MTQKRTFPFDIETSYLVELKHFYEDKFLNWLELEGNITSSVADLEIKLALIKDKNSARYLEVREIVNTLVAIRDSVSQFMFSNEKLRYLNKNLKMDNIRLREQNEMLQKQLLTQQKFNNL